VGKHHLSSTDLITIQVVKNIIDNWVYPQTEKTETALTWLQDYASNIQQGIPVRLTGDETKLKRDEQI
jgi:hypothetical protein